jgi:hypothetical protein
MNDADAKLMDSMAKLGYPMLEPAVTLDVNRTLAEVVKSHEIRYWEGFPVLLANAAESDLFSPEKVERIFETEVSRDQFHRLLILSGSVFSHYHLSYPWWRKFKKNLSDKDRALLKNWTHALAHNTEIKWNDTEFDPGRLKKQFELYFETKAEKHERKKQTYEELSLEFALSKIFSPKQKELFKKKLEGFYLNKTEQEYYSRVVKKKVVALANSQLHGLARKLLER